MEFALNQQYAAMAENVSKNDPGLIKFLREIV
jgi:hypothetical protein